MAVVSAQLTVGTTPVNLTTSPDDAVGGSAIAVQAPSGATLYIGAANVTASTGWPVLAGQSMSVDLGSGERLYGVLASGTGTVFVLRTGV